MLNTEVLQMKAIQKSVVNAAAVIMLFALMGCTVIGAGIGAVPGLVAASEWWVVP